MRFRVHDWLDTRTNKTVFGVQASISGERAKWCHCFESGVALIYAKKSEAKQKIEELRV